MIIPFIFLLLGCDDSVEILASVWQEEENFEVLKRLLYPNLLFNKL